MSRLCFLDKYLISLLCIGIASCRNEFKNSSVKELIPDSEASIESLDYLEEKSFYKLPRESNALHRVWNAYYWPIVDKGINSLTDVTGRSPLETFEEAYRYEIKSQFEEHIGKYEYGDFKQFYSLFLSSNAEDWWGYCHGGAVGSVIFPEPLLPVEHNEVVFTPFQIKGLISWAVAESSFQKQPPLFYGSRNNKEADLSTRSDDPKVRSINPALFHLSLGNLLDQKDIAMVADIVPGSVVLNFPIQSFKVKEIKDVSRNERYKSIKGISSEASYLLKVKTELLFVDNHRIKEQVPGSIYGFSKTYDYILELNAKKEIIGGEWINGSIEDHPDFLYAQKKVDLQQINYSDNIILGPALMDLAKRSNDTQRKLTPAELEVWKKVQKKFGEVDQYLLSSYKEWVPDSQLIE